MKEDSISFVFEVMRMKLEHLFDASNVLDQKISVMIGFLATIMVGLLVFFHEYLRFNICPLNSNFFSLGVGFLVIGVFLGILASTVRKFHYPPAEAILYSNESLNANIVDLKNQITADMKEGFERSLFIHEKKAKLFTLMLWIAFVGLIFVLVEFL